MTSTQSEKPLPHPTVPAADPRIETLLGQMTLEEKIGQMVQADLTWNQDVEQLIRQGRIGSLLSIRNPMIIQAYQKIAVEESRLGIPLLVGNDVIHGYRTIFPIPLAMSSTWDPSLVEEVARVIAVEAAAAGTSWNFGPMVDICRDPRWGRIAEGAGEDPFLGAQMAAAWVRGFQSPNLPDGRRLAACAKHFAAYGEAEGGRDYNTVDISEPTLRDVHLPPFHSALAAGALTMMTAFNELNGIPASVNPHLLQDILRREWGFDGVIISDYDALGELILHGYAQDHRQAAQQSLLAGVDVDMMGNAYHFHLAELVASGQVPESLIDDAVRRILGLKFRLGLFENPYVDEKLADQYLFHPAHKVLALKAAEESLVLLQNQGQLLPIREGVKTIALIGPLADERKSLLGCWSFDGRAEETPTLLESLQNSLPPDVRLLYARGCAIDGTEVDDHAAVEAANQADLVILAVGESSEMSGEAHSRAHLDLPSAQPQLVERLAQTQKPLAAVVFSGRPLTLARLANQAQAILLAWHGGTCTGQAIANALLGKTNPSGKLTASFPKDVGQIPVYYAHKNTGRPANAGGTLQFNKMHRAVYLDEATDPLYPFGYGLSYTEFRYSDLVVGTPRLRKEDTLVVTATVTNVGNRKGSEIAQCYVRDLVGSMTRPVKELKGFAKITLQAGEAQPVRFEIPAATLCFYGPHMETIVEAGDFKVWIGPDSHSGLEGTFTIID